MSSQMPRGMIFQCTRNLSQASMLTTEISYYTSSLCSMLDIQQIFNSLSAFCRSVETISQNSFYILSQLLEIGAASLGREAETNLPFINQLSQGRQLKVKVFIIWGLDLFLPLLRACVLRTGTVSPLSQGTDCRSHGLICSGCLFDLLE